jgi:hypothetical protein
VLFTNIGVCVKVNIKIGDWMGTRTDLDVMEKRKISRPCRESNSDASVVQPVA